MYFLCCFDGILNNANAVAYDGALDNSVCVTEVCAVYLAAHPKPKMCAGKSTSLYSEKVSLSHLLSVELYVYALLNDFVSPHPILMHTFYL